MLIGINLYGLSHPFIITETNTPIIDTHRQSLTAAEFWTQSHRYPGESDARYARRLRDIVAFRMLLVDPAFVRPGFAENWVLWIYAQLRGRFEWADVSNAVRMGGGFCSAHAMVFNDVAQQNGLRSRIQALAGHVLNEVWIDGRWETVDADYQVSIYRSVDELANAPDAVDRAYAAAGLQPWQRAYLQRVFSHQEKHRIYESAKAFAWKAYTIETLSQILIWLLPLLLMLPLFLSLARQLCWRRPKTEPGEVRTKT